MEDKEKCMPGGCNDGCSCAEEDADYLTLEFDDGQEVECEIMGVFEFEGKEYIALIPDDGSDDVYIYGYKETNDEEFELIDIEDDEEFKKVVEEFEKLTVEE
ncbi:MAG: DUF1292 domain-containing protein [Eubacteriales bacterium]|nr:DUF1292 domain-containing protein [Eubacteriales bacterium]MDD3200336.1 DUF1292 domain-containing protein [Eubacteriales bacterium]MDD4122005.1 DUF1292 domain-containing protein [Eubacteriales bacterium]MDD4630585.1 DUF1292 domain-containing protein [Eubacteriales bacterium]